MHLFDEVIPELGISIELVTAIRLINPWWQGASMRQLPATRRHLVGQIRRRLNSELAPIVVVRGSRQIGKTTAYEHIISDLLQEGVAPACILRLQFDELPALHKVAQPILSLVTWYERFVLGQTLNDAAAAGCKVYVFFDELQNLTDWAPQLKYLVDSSTVRVVVTGSSALRIEQGRDSLAGRIQTLEASVLSLTEIGAIRGLDTPAPFLPDNGLQRLRQKAFWQELAAYGRQHSAFRNTAFEAFAERGGYPIAHKAKDESWEQVADQLNETIVKRVIEHDLRVGENKGRKRDPQLLEQLFRLCCRYAGQCPSPGGLAQEIRATHNANVGDQRIRQYLKFLGDTLLIRLIDPLEIRLKRARGNAKICLADHALRASYLEDVVPLTPDADQHETLATQAGYLAESITGALFKSISGLDVNHRPAFKKAASQEPEIDFVLRIGTQTIPVEVKYRNQIKSEHYQALRQYVANQTERAPFGILITKTDDVTLPPDVPLVALPLASLLMMR